MSKFHLIKALEELDRRADAQTLKGRYDVAEAYSSAAEMIRYALQGCSEKLDQYMTTVDTSEMIKNGDFPRRNLTVDCHMGWMGLTQQVDLVEQYFGLDYLEEAARARHPDIDSLDSTMQASLYYQLVADFSRRMYYNEIFRYTISEPGDPEDFTTYRTYTVQFFGDPAATIHQEYDEQDE
jgi:hypothetical protein